MTQEDGSLSLQADGSSRTNPFTGIVRFLQVVRLRKSILIASLLVSAVLGGLYYFTAKPQYDSFAEVYIIQTDTGVLESTSGEQSIERQIPTFRNLFVGEVVLKKALAKLPKEHRIDFRKIPREKWISTLRNNLSVSSVRHTNLIGLRYRSEDPKTAAAVVDAVLSSYLDFMDETHKDGSRELLELLTNDQKNLEQKLSEKEAELATVRTESEYLGSVDGSIRSVTVERVYRLNQALVEAQKQTAEAGAFLSAVYEAVHNGEDIQQFLMQTNATIGTKILQAALFPGSTEDNYLLAQLQRQLIDDRAKLNNALDSLGLGRLHPQVRELNERIRGTEKYLQDTISDSLSRVTPEELGPKLIQMARQKTRHAIARQRAVGEQFEWEKNLAMSMGSQFQKIELLDWEVKRMRSFHDVLLERIRDIDLNKGVSLRTAIVSEPQVPTNPAWPKLRILVLLCVLLGIGGGLAIIYVVDIFDDRFRSPEEIRIQLGVPVLSMVRQMSKLEGDGIESVHTFAKPNGVASEAFRTLRTSITFAKESTQRIVVTSTEPGDGKTTTLINLAVAYAQTGKRTLLIDADMRRPGLSTLLDLRGSNGLSTILRDSKSIKDSLPENLFASGVDGLDVIPSGSRPINPAELLSSTRFAELLEWTETVYDQILIDAPPALAVTDPMILGRLVDGLLLVVRPDKNRRKMVIRTADLFAAADINVLGVVVNHVSANNQSGYYGYGYGDGYDYEYGDGNAYGHTDEVEQQHQDQNEPAVGVEGHHLETDDALDAGEHDHVARDDDSIDMNSRYAA